MADIENEKILCIPVCDTWFGPWKGRHHIMSRLLRRNEVFFVEEPDLSVLSIFREKRRIKRLWSWLFVRKPQKNLYLYTPILGLPFGNKYEIVNKINNVILFLNLWIVFKMLKFQPTIVFSFNHTYSNILNSFGARLTVYTAHDVWEVYPEKKKLRLLQRKYEEQTLRNVDVAFFTAKANMQRKAHLNPNSYYIPHGCPTPDNSSMLRENALMKPLDFPTSGDLFLGFWGVMTRQVIDIELLYRLAKRRPEWTFVLIGPVYLPDKKLFHKLAIKTNVFLLGEKRPDEFYKYFRFLDIALLCTPRTEMKLQCSPMKVWEYISAGLPIVSIPIEECKSLEYFIYFAEGLEEWEQMIVKAAAEETQSKRAHRLQFAESNTWDKRVQKITTILLQQLQSKHR